MSLIALLRIGIAVEQGAPQGVAVYTLDVTEEAIPYN
jgi:hypothetical protein